MALSEEDELLRNLFAFRFAAPPLQGRNFGNLFFLALTQMCGSEKQAIEAMSRMLKVQGQVLAVTWDHVHLWAELADGTLIAGEGNIDIPKHDPSIPIHRVYLEPKAQANPEAVQAIAESDCIVLAPGNLYTSTVPNLLVQGIPEALQQARAPLVYVLNLMTNHGETSGYTASDHVAQLVRYGGRVPDAILTHQGYIPDDLTLKYEAEAAYRVQVDTANLHRLGVKVVKQADVMSMTSLVRHDPARTAQALVELFAELAPAKSKS
jgi:uncharacterized cofD-like protein